MSTHTHLTAARSRDSEVLAAALRNLRRRAGQDLEEFADLADLSRATVVGVENNTVVPTRDILHAYLNTAGYDDHVRAAVRELWERVHRATRSAALASSRAEQPLRLSATPLATEVVRIKVAKPAARRTQVASGANPVLWPDPAGVDTLEQWAASLTAIKRSSALSYASIADASKACGLPLARSTVHALCTQAKLPSSPITVRQFITVCGGSSADADAWHLAWLRLRMVDAAPGEPRPGIVDPMSGLG